MRRDGRVLYLEGAVTFASAASLLPALERLIDDCAADSGEPKGDGPAPTLILDCGALVNSDSAALSVLMAATRRAVAAGLSPVIAGLGGQLASLSRLYGIDPILGLGDVVRQEIPSNNLEVE